MQTTWTAKPFMTPAESLESVLTSYSDDQLEQVVGIAQRVLNGAMLRVTHFTPKGFVVSKTHADKVKSCALAIMHKRTGL